MIDDAAGRTLAAASTADKDLRTSGHYGGNKAAAGAVGKAIAQRALAAGVKQVAFDRREYKYHGRVAALADAARDAGLDLGAKPPAARSRKPKPEPPSKKGPRRRQGAKRNRPPARKKAAKNGKPRPVVAARSYLTHPS